MDDGALINGVIRVYHLGGGETKKGVDRDEDNANGILMNGAPPLKMMIRSDEEWGSDISFPEGREGTIERLVNEREIGMAHLETSQESVVPSGEIYIRLRYKRGGEGVGGKRIRVAWGIRHTMDRLLVCQQ